MAFGNHTDDHRSVPNLQDLENYVFEGHGGVGVFVYHIERVSANSSQGFVPLTENLQGVNTQRSIVNTSRIMAMWA